MHPVSTAGGADFVVSSSDAIDLVLYDCSNSLDAVIGEGKDFGAVGVVDPQHAVFRLELVRQLPQSGFIAAEDLRGPLDCEDVGDCCHGSSGRSQVRLLPFPRQQCIKPALRGVGDAGEHVGQPGQRVDVAPGAEAPLVLIVVIS